MTIRIASDDSTSIQTVGPEARNALFPSQLVSKHINEDDGHDGRNSPFAASCVSDVFGT